MTESVAMLEIRKIKEENSIRYLNMTPKERSESFDKTTKWFIEEMEKRGKEIKVVSKPQ